MKLKFLVQHYSTTFSLSNQHFLLAILVSKTAIKIYKVMCVVNVVSRIFIFFSVLGWDDWVADQVKNSLNSEEHHYNASYCPQPFKDDTEIQTDVEVFFHESEI